MIEYKVKENQEGVDPLEQIIVKSGDTVEFSIGEIDVHEAYLKKAKKETDGQIGIQKATIENITRTHPHIVAMSQEDLTAAYLLREATGYLNIAEPKLIDIERQLVDYAAEKVEILKQTGIVLPEKAQAPAPTAQAAAAESK